MSSGFISRFADRLKKLFISSSGSDSVIPEVKKSSSPSDSDLSSPVKKKRKRKKKTAGKAVFIDERAVESSQSAPAKPSVQNAPSKPSRSSFRQEPDWDEQDSSVAVGIALKKRFDDWQVPQPGSREEDASYFQDFPLDNRLLKAILDDLQFSKCTPIQKLALPIAFEGKDLTGKAQTGTGKTAVFLISIIQAHLNSSEERRPNQPFALVLAPTRELAIQIAKDAEELSVYTPLRTVAVFGGMDYERQRRLLGAGCDLVVATPGRLIDYLNQTVIDFSKLKFLVIDEADRMLDMGFIPDVKRIIGQTPRPAERQTMLFSATLSRDIMNLASRWMRPEPVVLETEPEHIVAEGIQETVYACTSREKLPIILWLLSNEDCGRVLIFRNRRCDVEELHAKLQRYGVAAEMLSGDVDQKKRLRILEAFRQGKVKVIVATDVAGRGIHIDDITHVFNYDLPYEAEDYVHRIGRTARAGHQGRAISFAGEDCAFVIPEIETYIGRPLAITQPDEEMLEMPAVVNSDKYISSGSSRRRDSSRSRRSSRDSRPQGTRVRRGGPRR